MSTLFIGLGKMGAPMARCHAEAHATVLYDIGPAAAELAADLGAVALPTLDTIPEDVDTVILMVPSSAVVESILLDGGLLERLSAGALVIDMSSSIPSSTRRLAAEAATRSIAYVDAPVSGGQSKAIAGDLTVMVGGEADAVARALPHIQPMAGPIVQVGPSGSAHAAKALNNLLSATNIAAAAEVLAVATRFGIDPAVMIDVINVSTGRSQATEVKYPNFVLTGTYDSRFAMDLMLKDLGIARDLAAELGVDGPITGTAFDVARAARSALGTEQPDHTELARYYEMQQGISFSDPHVD